MKLGNSVATTTKEITDWKCAQEDVLRLTEEVAQARLRESEEQLRGFGEASSDVLWIRDAETLDWTYLSPAFESIYGLSREEALHGDTMRNWLDFVLREDRERAGAEIAKAREGERVTFEYRITRPSDGEVRLLRNPISRSATRRGASRASAAWATTRPRSRPSPSGSRSSSTSSSTGPATSWAWCGA